MSSEVTTVVVPFEKPKAPTAPVVEQPTVPPTQAATQVPGTPEVPAQGTAPEAPPQVPAADTPDFSSILKQANDEIATKGSISKESLAKIAEASGVPEVLLNYAHEGMKVERATRDSQVLVAAGGEPAYLEMVKWATQAYTSDEAYAFNSALVSGTKEEALAAVSSLRQKFTAVNGSPKSVVASATNVSTVPVSAPKVPSQNPTIVPFANLSELSAAQKDAKYGKDKAYTDLVYARTAISKF